MEFIWRLLLVYSIGLLLLIFCVVLLIKVKAKGYIPLSFGISFVIIFSSIILLPPLIKDLTKQEAVTEKIMYIDNVSKPKDVVYYTLRFKNNGEIKDLKLPNNKKRFLELEKGEFYIVEYYVNTKIIKNIKPYE